jgi:hypothetical protein
MSKGQDTGAATSSRRSHAAPQPTARLWSALFLLASTAFVAHFLFARPILAGDGHQYYITLQAWQEHGTPDIRESDIRQTAALLTRHGLDTSNLHPYLELATAKNGRAYYWHFWFYPLVALPAKLLLHLAHANECAAFQVTNALLFVLAVWFVLFRSRSPLPWRLAFAGLTAVSPVLGYLRWPHTEVFTWACVVISLALLSNRRYGGAALAAAFAAMQNPPVLLLALYIAVVSLRERDFRQTLQAAAGVLPALLPPLFCYLCFGVPNLIAAHGFSHPHLISAARTWSFLTDLNQGMLPYVPLLLLLALPALAQAVARRSAAGLGLAAVILLIILGAETTPNWNSGCVGMLRYGVWVVPLFAWLVVEYLPPARSLHRLIAAAVALHGAIAWQYQGRFDYLTQSPLALFVLDHAPALYDPDIEIFCERQLHGGCDFRRAFPMGFVRRDGTVAKLLTDAAGLSRLQQFCAIRPDYLTMMERKLQDRPGPVYFSPPRGAMRMGDRASERPLPQKQANRQSSPE